MPAGLLVAFGWIKWSPMPIAAMASFFAFYLTVKIAMLWGGPIFRWLKLVGD
jgi:hypothetical protein